MSRRKQILCVFFFVFPGLAYADCPPGPFYCVPSGPGTGGVTPAPPPPPPFYEIVPKYLDKSQLHNKYILADEEKMMVLPIPDGGLLENLPNTSGIRDDSFYIVPNKYVRDGIVTDKYLILKGDLINCAMF
jgi:hypothetical protein